MNTHDGTRREGGAGAWIAWLATFALGCGLSHPTGPFGDGGDVTGDRIGLDGDAHGLDADSEVCPSGLANCGGVCVPLTTAHDHCGECGRACALTETCESGACVPACAGSTPLTCNGMCVASDSTHCGSCSNACRSDQVCTAGACVCPAGRTACGAACADVTSDGNNCGACGTVCTAGMMCMGGHCTTTCTGGTTACGASCVNLTNDPNHCGACGTVCTPMHVGVGPQCSGSACGYIGGCSIGFGDCDGNHANGCEQSTSNDPNNCGSCGHACPSGAQSTATCSGGFCGITCTAGYADCDGNPANGCEVNLNTSTSNCGHCGMSCGAGANSTAICTAGACGIVCASGYADCNGSSWDGCEAALNSVNTCGGCSTMCTTMNGTPSCGGGGCAIQSCNGGWGNCDGNVANGCETQLNTVANCGACGTACTPVNGTGACGGSGCQIASCNGGYRDCDGIVSNGCEVALNTNANCGGCGTACAPSNATATCATGSCTIVMCSAGYGDCDSSVANGCETQLTTHADCGGCGMACHPSGSDHVASSTCSTGTCVIMCTGGHLDCNHNPADGCEHTGATCP